jgi:hypothetical protein
VFEFAASEAVFREWAQSIDVPLQEIRGQAAIERYLSLDEDAPPDALTEVSVTDGLAGRRRSKGGNGYDLVYDRTSSRCYGAWASH